MTGESLAFLDWVRVEDAVEARAVFGIPIPKPHRTRGLGGFSRSRSHLLL
jgi:hypothetical protein